jgi:hypothetical protein
MNKLLLICMICMMTACAVDKPKQVAIIANTYPGTYIFGDGDEFLVLGAGADRWMEISEMLDKPDLNTVINEDKPLDVCGDAALNDEHSFSSGVICAY